MHNTNTIIFYDYETCSKNPHKTQPIQLAAVAIHSRKLEIIPNSEFESMIFAVDDEEECTKAGLDTVQDEALAVNKKTREQVLQAPKLKSVWSDFTSYVNNYNYKKNSWGAPILAGFNNTNFDDIITNRICGPNGWNLGPWDAEYGKNSLFHPIHGIDLMKIAWGWFECCAEPKRLNMDALREFFGLSTENSHDALVDVQQGAELLCRFLKLQRGISSKVNWKNNG
jgi:DNA polymerase III epsilon subunit-like protein